MHEALRTAAKLYRAQGPMHKLATFRPNGDTPSDLRAEYLRTPHEFGLHARDDILGWSRQASNATLLKTDTYPAIAALVLFERERPEAVRYIRALASDRTPGEFSWLQEQLSLMHWTPKQLNTMMEFTSSTSVNVVADKPPLLNTFMNAMDRHGRASLDPNWLSERLFSYSLIELIEPFENMTMHKAALALSWERLIRSTALASGSQETGSQQAAADWHCRGPTRNDCLDLARMLDVACVRLAEQGETGVENKWRERSAIVLPWVSMMGSTLREGQRALDIYQTMDPGLLTFSTIASAVDSPELDAIDNVSELLCP